MMQRLRNSTLSSRGSRPFFLLRQMLVTQWRPRCQRRASSTLEIALIRKDLPVQGSSQALKWFAVIGAAVGHPEGLELALVVDAQVELEAREPAHGGATTPVLAPGSAPASSSTFTTAGVC